MKTDFANVAEAAKKASEAIAKVSEAIAPPTVEETLTVAFKVTATKTKLKALKEKNKRNN